MSTLPVPQPRPFYGDTIVRAAFVIAMLGWGVGFYGPPVYLAAVVARTGWPLALVSAAVTVHFLFGAAVIAFMPALHRRFGVPAVTAVGAAVLTTGVLGWAVARDPAQLMLAAVLTGGGWVPLGATGINAIVSPWFASRRPMALGKAYNGASVGGMVFSPLWAGLIAGVGFPAAAMLVGAATVAVVLFISVRVLGRTPATEGQFTDGLVPAPPAPAALAAEAELRRCPALWRDRRFLTLAAAMALGLFAQIGLLTQLFSLMLPSLGAQAAGGLMALATGCGMGGRLVLGRLLGPRANRRRAAALGYAVQAAGTLVLLLAGAEHWSMLVLGVALFGSGIGNATSLPPLIAQSEFARADVPRVVARSVAVSQAFYALAPAALAGLLAQGAMGMPALGAHDGAYFGAIFSLQLLAAACMLSGSSPSARQ